MILGCSGLGNLYSSISDEAAWHTLETAWSSGIRAFDTAPSYGYGLSESRLGSFLKGKNRLDYFISTKVGRLLKPLSNPHALDDPFVDVPPLEAFFDYTYEGIYRSFEDSIKRLNTSVVDVLYIHDIGTYTHKNQNNYYMSQILESGYLALRELKEEGSIQAIGVGVNEWPICGILMNQLDLDVFLVAGCYNLLKQDLVNLFPLIKGKKLYNAGVFASGILASENEKPMFNYKPASLEVKQKVSQLKDICNTYNTPLGAAALQFAKAPSEISDIIIGAQTSAHIEQILKWLNYKIPPKLWSELIFK